MHIWAPSSEFVSSSIPSWQSLTAHAQPFRGARDLAFCLKVPLYSLLLWASSEGSGETARMRRLAWTFAARIGDKYQIRLTRSILKIQLMLTHCWKFQTSIISDRIIMLLNWYTVSSMRTTQKILWIEESVSGSSLGSLCWKVAKSHEEGKFVICLSYCQCLPFQMSLVMKKRVFGSFRPSLISVP